jgi:hypothetical protein
MPEQFTDGLSFYMMLVKVIYYVSLDQTYHIQIKKVESATS